MLFQGMRIPIWLVPVVLGGWFYASGEDPGMGLPFVVGPAAVAWFEGWWSHRAARVEAVASARVARVEAEALVRVAEIEARTKLALAALAVESLGDSADEDPS